MALTMKVAIDTTVTRLRLFPRKPSSPIGEKKQKPLFDLINSILLMMALTMNVAIDTAVTRLRLLPRKPSSPTGEKKQKPLFDLINSIAYRPIEIRF
jgi:hypothetical protein